jgi:predicted esterase
LKVLAKQAQRHRLHTPTLYVYGSADPIVPTARCIQRLTALGDSGRPVSYHVFAGEGHELGGVSMFGYQFADGYADLLGDFAAGHVQ